jgi:hypothetical protein
LKGGFMAQQGPSVNDIVADGMEILYTLRNKIIQQNQIIAELQKKVVEYENKKENKQDNISPQPGGQK